MIISVKMDEKRLALEKKMDLIGQMMIDNINRHLEDKEQKARETELAQGSSPKEEKSSSDTIGKES